MKSRKKGAREIDQTGTDRDKDTLDLFSFMPASQVDPKFNDIRGNQSKVTVLDWYGFIIAVSDEIDGMPAFLNVHKPEY